MPINPDDFIRVADELHGGRVVSRGEPCDRSIIGRAYYASYLALRNAVRAQYHRPDADIDHSPLRKGLAAATDPEVAEVGEKLKTLWKFRRRADYEPTMSINSVQAKLMLDMAKQVIKAAPKIIGRIPAGIPTA